MYQQRQVTGIEPRDCVSPTILLRYVELISAIVVFSLLFAHGSIGDTSLLNQKAPPLHFAEGIGIFSFLIALIFICLTFFNQASSALVSSVQTILHLDVFLALLNMLLWIIAFAWMVHDWRLTSHKNSIPKENKSAIEAAIAFSFISFACWTASVFTAYKAYKHLNGGGASEDYLGAADPGTAYAAFEDFQDPSAPTYRK